MPQTEFITQQNRQNAEVEGNRVRAVAEKERKFKEAAKVKEKQDEIASAHQILDALAGQANKDNKPAGRVMHEAVQSGQDPFKVFDQFYGKDASKKIIDAEKKRIEDKRDLAAHSTQEQNIVLLIDTPGGRDNRFRFDLGNCRFWIGEGIYTEVGEMEILHRPQKPGYVPHHLHAPR